MITQNPHNMDAEDRCERVGQSQSPAGRFTDIHCHCLPNLDDGPRSLDESLALCQALLEDNIGTVVATPHQLGRFETRTTATRICEGVQQLNRELSQRGLDLTVLPGAEVRLDERICILLAQDEIFTLADRRRNLLLELPDDAFIDIEPLLRMAAVRGVTAILAHPERNSPLLRHLHTLLRWRTCGVRLQVTAGSIVGSFGRQAQEAAWELLTRGWVDIVATDAHDAGANGPCMTEAFTRVVDECGRDLACFLCIENPARVIKGREVIPACSPSGQEVG